jgi:amino acid transporter
MKWLKNLVIGKARDLSDEKLFHRVSLIAVLAWVGLGADGLSSSCYGPEETFRALGSHIVLAPFVALACVITIATLCTSYSQIIELFPGGGGGYLVASKLLSPSMGAISGCALLVDYVLTIALSIASGVDALFSVLPPEWREWKLAVSLSVTALLTVVNLRGVKESVLIWVPVFMIFVVTHAFALLFAIGTHVANLPAIVSNAAHDMSATHSQVGWLGVLFILIRAYSMGAGTYTGIEAVSNALPILREPRAETGKRTMLYMGASLGTTVAGLMLAYLLYNVAPQEGKTLNAVLFEKVTAHWPAGLGHVFMLVTMLSATALLFVAALTGFLDGPRVLANMALDRWFPTRFAMLSDRFVTQNGILLMGGASLIILLMSGGYVGVLVVLYSINVFITFTLSQLGMVKHWWTHRETEPTWRRKFAVNGFGLCLTVFILTMLCVTKFWQGGWVTLFLTGLLVIFAFSIRRHYHQTVARLARLDDLVKAFEADSIPLPAETRGVRNQPGTAKTAVILVNGYNGLGVHTLLAVTRMFTGVFNNFVFLQVGVIDAGSFKGSDEVDNLRRQVDTDAMRYAEHMKKMGINAEAVTGIGTDVIETADELSNGIMQRYPNAIFFGGQLVFSRETRFTRLLHNFVVFELQRKLFNKGAPFLILPIRV